MYKEPKRIVEAKAGVVGMGARSLQGLDPEAVRASGSCAKEEMPRKGRCAGSQ